MSARSYEGQHASAAYKSPSRHLSHSEQRASSVVDAPAAPTQPGTKEKTDKHDEHTPHWALVDATYVLAVVTFGLAWFTYRLWAVTSNLVREAGENSQRQLRAYVSAKVKKQPLLNGPNDFPRLQEYPEVGIRIKNTGQTPAYNLTAWARMWIREYPADDDFPGYDGAAPLARVHLPPGGFITQSARSAAPINIEQRMLVEMDLANLRLYVWGEIHYTDAFGVSRFTKFRFMYGGTDIARGGRMAWCETGNETDQDHEQAKAPLPWWRFGK